MSHQITEQEILDAQQAWGEGIVKIGNVFQGKGDYSAAAEAHIDQFYNYGKNREGSVLFKPTLAAEKQFRLTFEGALSYFVGGNSNFSEDNTPRGSRPKLLVVIILRFLFPPICCIQSFHE